LKRLQEKNMIDYQSPTYFTILYCAWYILKQSDSKSTKSSHMLKLSMELLILIIKTNNDKN
jgi:hypothetical protein